MYIYMNVCMYGCMYACMIFNIVDNETVVFDDNQFLAFDSLHYPRLYIYIYIILS